MTDTHESQELTLPENPIETVDNLSKDGEQKKSSSDNSERDTDSTNESTRSLQQDDQPESPACETTKQETAATVAQVPSQTSSNQVQTNPQIYYEQQMQKMKRDLESMVLKYAKSERENLQNQLKVDNLDKKLKRVIKDNDQLANRIKILTTDKNQLMDTLNAKVAQLTVLEQKKSFISNEQTNKLKECEEKITTLEASNEDLLKQIESYKSKEGELLDFCERLSAKNTLLEAESDEANKKLPDYKAEYESVLEQLNESRRSVESLTDDLSSEVEKFSLLQAEKEKNEVIYRDNLDKLQNEIKVMRRKHQTATRELVKEIKHLQAKSKIIESKRNEQHADSLAG